MRIVDFYKSDIKETALKQLKNCKWTFSETLVKFIETDTFYQQLGKESNLLLLVNRDNDIAAFLTLSEKYVVDDEKLSPWIGFVYTFEKYRGNRYSGLLIEKACDIAKERGHKRFISLLSIKTSMKTLVLIILKIESLSTIPMPESIIATLLI